ncbi:MAG: NAD(P)-binding domain-containing protein, partial [Sporosarcina sp.]
MEKKKVAFIGTGVMGASVVAHLLNNKYEVTVYTRTKEKAELLIEAGAGWAETINAAIKDADIVFTMVGYPADVEEV